MSQSYLLIQAYESEEDAREGGANQNSGKLGEFMSFCPLNSFENFRQIHWASRSTRGSSNPNPEYSYVDKSPLSFEIFIDATGVIEALVEGYYLNNKPLENKGLISGGVGLARFRNPMGNDYVAKATNLIIDVCQKLARKTQAPPVLKIAYGGKVVFARSEKITINHQLFDDQGHPLRTKINLSFCEVLSEKEQKAQVKRDSPEQTRSQQVESGESLPQLTQRMYGDPKYYPEVARINGLQNFRDIKPGTILIFPPLKKSN